MFWTLKILSCRCMNMICLKEIALVKDKLELHNNKWKPFISRYGTHIS